MAAIISNTPGSCGVETVSINQNDQNIVFYSPVVKVPTGFSIDQAASLTQHKQIFVQNDSTVSSSKILLSCEAILKSDIPNIYTIDHFISERLKVIKLNDPSVSTTGLQGLNTGDGKPLKSILITSEISDDTKIAAYQEDGKYYVVFEIVFKGGKDNGTGFQAFVALVNSYQINSK